MTRAEKRRNVKAEAKLAQYKKSGYRHTERRISITPTPTKSGRIPEAQRVAERHVRAIQKMDWRKAMQKLGVPVSTRAPHAQRGTAKRLHGKRTHSNIIKGARP